MLENRVGRFSEKIWISAEMKIRLGLEVRVIGVRAQHDSVANLLYR
jgi:hypothetical protein